MKLLHYLAVDVLAKQRIVESVGQHDTGQWTGHGDNIMMFLFAC